MSNKKEKCFSSNSKASVDKEKTIISQ